MTLNFDQIIGQNEVIRYLRWSLKENAVPKTLILFGEPGIGKTTLARTLSKALLCGKRGEGACNVCSSCESFENGNHLDYHEMDSALHSTVESMRDVVEITSYAPQLSRCRVFVLDECHRLSVAAFSSILKTLEEGSPYNYFLMVTTDVEKLPDNVVSRSVRLRLIPPSMKELKDYTLRSLADTTVTDSELLELISVSKLRPRDLYNLISMFKVVKDLQTIKYLLGIPRRSLLTSYWVAVEGSMSTVANLLLEKINLVTGSYWSTLNFLLAELKVLNRPVTIDRAAKILVALARQNWLSPQNLAFLFTGVVSGKRSYQERELMLSLSLRNKRLYSKVVRKWNRLTFVAGRATVLGSPKLSKELQNYCKSTAYEKRDTS